MTSVIYDTGLLISGLLKVQGKAKPNRLSNGRLRISVNHLPEFFCRWFQEPGCTRKPPKLPKHCFFANGHFWYLSPLALLGDWSSSPRYIIGIFEHTSYLYGFVDRDPFKWQLIWLGPWGKWDIHCVTNSNFLLDRWNWRWFRSSVLLPRERWTQVQVPHSRVEWFGVLLCQW